MLRQVLQNQVKVNANVCGISVHVAIASLTCLKQYYIPPLSSAPV